tara:strand:+ start:394 stop:840 length:447 start_codon:yes stop_codon:yes gene_type:complete
VSAQERIDSMLGVVVQNVITQSDIETLRLINQYHIPETSILYERSGNKSLDFLMETEILHALASGVPIYSMTEKEQQYSTALFKKIYKENPYFLYKDRIDYWLKAQIIAENYIRINLGITQDNNLSMSTYLRWVEDQKKRVPHRKIKP